MDKLDLGSKTALNMCLWYNDIIIKNTEVKKLLGVILDNNLNVNSDLKRLCKIQTQKSNAPSKMSRLLQLQMNQKALILNFFIKRQFNYCPLVRMFCLRKSIYLINRAEEKALRLCNENENLTIGVGQTNNETIHIKNFFLLQTEVYKSLTRSSPRILKHFLP